MPAQPGSSIVLAYGPQGMRQTGDAVMLAYGGAPAATQRFSVGAGAVWGRSSTLRPVLRALHGATNSHVGATRAPWVDGIALDRGDRSAWGVAGTQDAAAEAPWSGPMAHLDAADRAPWGIATASDNAATGPWLGPLTRLDRADRAPWGIAAPVDQARRAPWIGPLRSLQPVRHAPWGIGIRRDALRWVPWLRFGRVLAPGWGVVTPTNPDPDEPLYAIHPARFFMLSNSLTATRLPDLSAVPLYSATVSADAGSYCWQLQASAPIGAFEALLPDGGAPRQLRVTINGIEWVFAIDKVWREAEFGRQSARIAGRSVTALIGAPYARPTTRTNTGARTAQQLAEDALNLSGVTLDWGLTDWLVPAGAWSHAGTPLAAVQAIVEAAGGFVQSHRSEAVVLARHPYPVGPWDWPSELLDVTLAPDVVVRSAIEHANGPDINAVYVSGTVAGVLALVKREGTAADKLAPMVADPLITHVDAARQRGLAILGRAGPKRWETYDLPVLTGVGEPGVLAVGQLVEIDEDTPRRGRVTAVSVRAEMPVVLQTVTLEHHL